MCLNVERLSYVFMSSSLFLFVACILKQGFVDSGLRRAIDLVKHSAIEAHIWIWRACRLCKAPKEFIFDIFRGWNSYLSLVSLAQHYEG